MNQPDDLSSTDVVFHYTTAATATEHILAEGKFRLSSLANTGDPAEYKLWMPQAIGDSPLGNFVELHTQTIEAIERIRKNEFKIGCFSRNTEVHLHLDDESTMEVKRSGYDHSRMWSQYAHDHTGVCLAFDATIIEQAIRTSLKSNARVELHNVHYQPCSDFDDPILDANRILREDITDYTRDFLWQNREQLFFLKDIDYEHEAEVRILVFDPSPQEYFYFPIHEALQAILIGDNFVKAGIPLLKEQASTLSVDIMQLYWSNRKPYLIGIK